MTIVIIYRRFESGTAAVIEVYTGVPHLAIGSGVAAGTLKVFEAAMTKGDDPDFLTKKNEKLKQGQWNPEPRK
jgi:hypothetical protein